MRVKICGIRQEEALDAAVAGGADMVGFLHYPASPRHVEVQEAGRLRALLPERVKAVVVGVDMADELLAELNARVRPDLFQLHGLETPQRVAEVRGRFGVGVIKALRVRDGRDIEAAEAYRGSADMILFDGCGAALPGGNGMTFDWSLLGGYRGAGGWILSGGLTAENVADGILQTGATAVDVSSGVETAPGQKDAARIMGFLKAAKGAVEMAA